MGSLFMESVTLKGLICVAKEPLSTGSDCRFEMDRIRTTMRMMQRDICIECVINPWTERIEQIFSFMAEIDQDKFTSY